MAPLDPETHGRLKQEAEFLDTADISAIVALLVGILAGGGLAALAYAHIQAQQQRRGKRAVVDLAGRTLQELRTAEPYTPETDLIVRVIRLYDAGGIQLSPGDLPPCPPIAAPVVPHPAPTTQRWNPFIAYAGPDRPTALGLHARLDARGLRPFIDCRNIPADEHWPTFIPEALETTDRAVFLLSGHTPKAWYQSAEVIRAVELRREKRLTILPVHLTTRPPSTIAIPYGLEGLQSLCLPEIGSLDQLADRLVMG